MHGVRDVYEKYYTVHMRYDTEKVGERIRKKLFELSKAGWNSALVDLTFDECRRMAIAGFEKDMIGKPAMDALLNFLSVVFRSKAELFGHSERGMLSTWRWFGSQRVHHTNRVEGTHREVNGHAGLPGTTKATTLSRSAGLMGSICKRREEAQRFEMRKEDYGILDDKSIPLEVRTKFVMPCSMRLAKAFKTAVTKRAYKYFRDDADPHVVYAVWACDSTAYAGQRPRLHAAHRMEVTEEPDGGGRRVTCYSLHCQQMNESCPHVIGLNGKVGVGDAGPRHEQAVFNGNKDQQTFDRSVGHCAQTLIPRHPIPCTSVRTCSLQLPHMHAAYTCYVHAAYVPQLRTPLALTFIAWWA
jgi:hypothetical protein